MGEAQAGESEDNSLVMSYQASLKRLTGLAIGALTDPFLWSDHGTPTNFQTGSYPYQIEAAYRWLEFAAAHGLIKVEG